MKDIKEKEEIKDSPKEGNKDPKEKHNHLEVKDHKLSEKPEKLSMTEKERLLIQVKEELEKEKGRKISLQEARAAAVAQGTGHNYISPFAIALNATNSQIGILASTPGIVGPLAQLLGSRLIEKGSRRKIVSGFVFLEALIWIPILILGLLSYFGIFAHNLPLILIILYALLIFLGNMATPAWFSWMGDLVPEKIRGKYFAKRNRIYGAISMTSMLIAAFLLDLFKTRGLALVGFSTLFLVANIARLRSAYLLSKKHEPKIKIEKEYYFSIFSFFKKMPFNNFGRFVIFISLFHLAIYIGAPFFAVYLLRELNFSYIWYMAITLTPSIIHLIFLPIFGKFSDLYGNRVLVKIGAMLIPFVPLLWMLSPNPIYLMFVPGLFSGIGWAAFGLGITNFIYDSVTPQKRGLVIAYYSITVGIGIFIGGLLGSSLIKYVALSFMTSIFFVFLISGIVRFLVSLMILPKIKEPRLKVKKPKGLAVTILKEIRLPHIMHYQPAWFKHFFKFRGEKR